MTVDLAAISAENTGVAYLLTVSLDASNPEPLADRFDEGDLFDGEPSVHGHPIARAQMLWSAIESDWPDRLFSIVGNDRAKYLAWVERMRLLDENWPATPEAYIEAKNGVRT